MFNILFNPFDNYQDFTEQFCAKYGHNYIPWKLHEDNSITYKCLFCNKITTFICDGFEKLNSQMNEEN